MPRSLGGLSPDAALSGPSSPIPLGRHGARGGTHVAAERAASPQVLEGKQAGCACGDVAAVWRHDEPERQAPRAGGPGHAPRADAPRPAGRDVRLLPGVHAVGEDGRRPVWLQGDPVAPRGARMYGLPGHPGHVVVDDVPPAGGRHRHDVPGPRRRGLRVLLRPPGALFAARAARHARGPRVVLIAQPGALFATPSPSPSPSPEERLLAVGVALLGVLGAAGAFTALRAIGKRAHPLISVNAFAMVCTVVCVAALGLGPVLDVAQPSLRWVAPASPRQWLLLLSLSALGFVMQCLLTAGLAADKSNRANAMVYTHMLFAASFDRWVFGHRMGLVSFAGCALILGGALAVVFVKSPPPPLPGADDAERQGNLAGEAEGSPMLLGVVAGHVGSVNPARIR
ncbi:Integral membrane family protein [Metarhizium album ARSEF 1941]|uniref:Integral membrane family protein n=1 Tax=Metarhizium album (strain ARSEF 1941) TaxID=1081103 RepID=A0A0B2X8R9_METAS|nr:Integral membrane family protein [Metarhizium album ARSEF 1941]KHO01945.1 Integral membrane family protein [Metarhizium album ARSEF 1941]